MVIRWLVKDSIPLGMMLHNWANISRFKATEYLHLQGQAVSEE
jgi:hypothetical protein